MSAIRKIIQRQLFQKDNERIQAILSVFALDGKRRENLTQTLLCLAVTIEHPIEVRLYFVKGEKDDTFKKKGGFNLREVREVDGINPHSLSSEFHITIGDRQFVILADSGEDKFDFIEELYKLSCQYLPDQLPDFCNFSLPQLEAEVSIIPIELPVHEIAMQSDYQPVSQKEDADFRKLIEKADLTIRHAHLSAEKLTKQLQSLDGANINSMMDSENSVNHLLSSIDAVLSGVKSVEKELDRCDNMLAFVRNSIELIEEKDSLLVVERKNKQRLNDEIITFVKSLEAVTDMHIETLKQANFSNPESSTPPKNLSDMPIDVAGLIIERSDYKEQLILRKTSKSLRELVDKQKPACTRLDFYCTDGCIICKYNEYCVAYVSPTFDRELLERTGFVVDTIIRKVNYQQMVSDDLAFTLKNPKLQLESFEFFNRCDCQNDNVIYMHREYGTMYNVLKSINHQLSVKEFSVRISNPSHVMSTLSYIKPGVLEKIELLHGYGWEELIDPVAMEQIALLDQWKQAKELQMNCEFDEYFDEYMKHFTHFKRFHINEGFDMFLKVDSIIEYLMEHENVEFCSISSSDPEELLDDIANTTPVSPKLVHYTTPNSDYYLEIVAKDDFITIEKKKKRSF